MLGLSWGGQRAARINTLWLGSLTRLVAELARSRLRSNAQHEVAGYLYANDQSALDVVRRKIPAMLSLASPNSANLPRPFSVSSTFRAKCGFHAVQGIGLGPQGWLTHFDHVADMDLDEIGKGCRRIDICV